MKARQKHTALVYDKRGRLLAVGTNDYVRTHPLQAFYASKTENKGRVYLHAELSALIKAKRRGTIHTLVVIRTDKKGNHMLSKPCTCCEQAIADFGVVKLIHS